MSDNIKYYQSIPELGIVGRMPTHEEFDKIGLPKKLKDKTVLEIGCNMGAFLIESAKRGGFCVGVEPNLDWRLLANGLAFELNLTRDLVTFEKVSDVTIGEGFDVVMLLSVLHVCGDEPQKLLDEAYRMTRKGGLLIVEINDRLQENPVLLPKEAKKYGKNKDNRTVWHIVK